MSNIPSHWTFRLKPKRLWGLFCFLLYLTLSQESKGDKCQEKQSGRKGKRMVCSLHRFPVPHKQVRFNVFFYSLRFRILRLSTGMEGRATKWQLLPPLPSMGKGIGMERCLTAWTLRRLPRRVSHSDLE